MPRLQNALGYIWMGMATDTMATDALACVAKSPAAVVLIMQDNYAFPSSL